MLLDGTIRELRLCYRGTLPKRIEPKEENESSPSKDESLKEGKGGMNDDEGLESLTIIRTLRYRPSEEEEDRERREEFDLLEENAAGSQKHLEALKELWKA